MKLILYRAFDLKETMVLMLCITLRKCGIRVWYDKSLLETKAKLEDLLAKGYKTILFKKGIWKLQHVTNNQTYYVRRNTSDLIVFEQVVIATEYAEILQAIKRNNTSERPICVLDLGANCGLFTYWILQNACVQRIVAIEPDSENFEFGSHLVQYYNVPDSVLWYHGAVWPTDNATLYIHENFRDGKHWARSISVHDTGTTRTVTPIGLQTLVDAHFSENQFNIIKMDIEGSEFEIIQHTPDLPKLLAVTELLAIEIHEEFGGADPILTTLAQLGFTSKKINETYFFTKNYARIIKP